MQFLVISALFKCRKRFEPNGNKFLYVLVEGPSKIMEIYQQKAGDGVPWEDVGLSAVRDFS